MSFCISHARERLQGKHLGFLGTFGAPCLTKFEMVTDSVADALHFGTFSAWFRARFRGTERRIIFPSCRQAEWSGERAKHLAFNIFAMQNGVSVVNGDSHFCVFSVCREWRWSLFRHLFGLQSQTPAKFFPSFSVFAKSSRIIFSESDIRPVHRRRRASECLIA